MTQKVTMIQAYSSIYPNTMLKAEWDCLAQILDTMKELGPMAPSIDHIKGHQDETTPYKELHLLAQLKCNTDCHANAFLQDHPDFNHKTAHQFQVNVYCN